MSVTRREITSISKVMALSYDVRTAITRFMLREEACSGTMSLERFLELVNLQDERGIGIVTITRPGSVDMHRLTASRIKSYRRGRVVRVESLVFGGVTEYWAHPSQ